MTTSSLPWQAVTPDVEKITQILQEHHLEADFLTLQPRLKSTLSLLCPEIRQSYHPRFMLLKAPDSPLIYSLLQHNIRKQIPANYGGYAYYISDNQISLTSAKNQQDNFATSDNCLFSTYVDSEALFGCVRQPEGQRLKLQPGLVHKVNGGVLILSLRSLLEQQDLWHKLKQMVIWQEFTWLSTDDTNPLPFMIPSMPLDLRVILVGDRLSMAELQDLEPEFYDSALYTEFENDVNIHADDNLIKWAGYVKSVAQFQKLPEIDVSAYAELVKMGIKHTEDQHYLPLIPDWINTQLVNAAQVDNRRINSETIKTASKRKNWQEDSLIVRLREAILNKQILINTHDQIIGQINGLSVIEYPGHPKTIGEPTRLSCLIHNGDGEINDIERKNDLAGNIHSKGMMIMQSFITSEFALSHPLPFSASLVFEQSYNEVDGDSASLAGLSVIISALSGQPINQQIAVTGSVDQFGHVQAIGGVNQKIEGFFAICQHQGLTGQQGVIIPASNQNHLCLNDEVVMAIKNNQFHIWAVENVADALLLLTGIPYNDNSVISLHKIIKARIQAIINGDKRSARWFNKWRK